MARIDIGRTAFAGFSLVRRRPLAVGVWGLFILVLGVLPVVGLLAAMGPAFADLIALGKTGADPTPEQMMPFMTAWYAANPILWLLGLVTRVMLTGAVFRAVLEPGASSWAYLRLGMGEVMLALVVICLSILLTIGAAIWAAVTVGVCFALWQASHGGAIGFGVVSGVALTVTVIWVLLRLSLAAPMSFAERNFRLFESWTVTRGNALNLLLTAIIMALVLVVLQTVVVALLAAIALAAGGVAINLGDLKQLDAEAVEAFFRQPPATWMSVLGPWIVLGGLIASIVGAVFVTVATAPWAEAYRQLRGTPEPTL